VISAYAAGVGLRAPGLPDWATSRLILAGTAPYRSADMPRPTGACLPATERRRATLVTRLALDVAAEALADVDPNEVGSVFASSGGEVDIIHGIFDQLAGMDTRLSPTAFHNSVHNAASGYWSIATGSRQPATSVSAFDTSFGAGLAEAMLRCKTEGADTLLVAYDMPPPCPIAEHRPLAAPFAMALLLRPDPVAGVFARLTVTLQTGLESESQMADPDLERLRRGNPAARSLPLLQTLATPSAGRLSIAHGPNLCLLLEVEPWF
jgi:hypothetical protein